MELVILHVGELAHYLFIYSSPQKVYKILFQHWNSGHKPFLRHVFWSMCNYMAITISINYKGNHFWTLKHAGGSTVLWAYFVGKKDLK